MKFEDFLFWLFVVFVVWSVIGLKYCIWYMDKKGLKDNAPIPFYVRFTGGPLVWYLRFRIWRYNKRRGL